MNREEAGALLAEVKANQNRLDGCARHLFEIGEPPYQFGMKLTCQRCGGVIDAVKAFVYVQGYEAAGGDPNDVIPGFK